MTMPGAPAAPCQLHGTGDHDNIVLTWQQQGHVDNWTVYLDPLDGSETVTYWTGRPQFEVADLAPGEYEIGVVAWRAGQPSAGAGTFIVVDVPGAPADAPAPPRICGLRVSSSSIEVSWPDSGATAWRARLLDRSSAVLRTVEGKAGSRAVLSGLVAATTYGIQLGLSYKDLAPSRWSALEWLATSSASGHMPAAEGKKTHLVR